MTEIEFFPEGCRSRGRARRLYPLCCISVCLMTGAARPALAFGVRLHGRGLRPLSMVTTFSESNAPILEGGNKNGVTTPKNFGRGGFLERMGNPTFIAAPMVEHSEAAFRYLVRRHGADLAFTQMIHSGQFADPSADKFRKQRFDGVDESADRPLIVQFCGNDPGTLVQAARHIEGRVDAVDLNLGCPQKIARRGDYGAFLLDRPELCERIVGTMSRELSVPVTVKIRCMENTQETLLFAKRLEAAGAQMLTVHGRTLRQSKTRQGAANWDIIRQVKEAVTIPVVANGGVETRADVGRLLRATGADAVMSSEALLEDPSLFDNNLAPLDQLQGLKVAHRLLLLASEYMELVQTFPPQMASVRGHLFKMLYRLLECNHDLRAQLAHFSTGIPEAGEIVKEMCRRYFFDPVSMEPLLDSSEAPHVPISTKSWYHRHRDDGGVNLTQSANVVAGIRGFREQKRQVAPLL